MPRVHALLGEGTWNVARQSLDASEPFIVFGSRAPTGLGACCSIYRIDEDGARLVGLFFKTEHEPTDMALLPNGRLAIMAVNRLFLASTVPALQIVDELKLRSSRIVPALKGNALVIPGYKLTRGDDLPPLTSVVGIYDDTLVLLGQVEEEAYGDVEAALGREDAARFEMLVDPQSAERGLHFAERERHALDGQAGVFDAEVARAGEVVALLVTADDAVEPLAAERTAVADVAAARAEIAAGQHHPAAAVVARPST